MIRSALARSLAAFAAVLVLAAAPPVWAGKGIGSSGAGTGGTLVAIEDDPPAGILAAAVIPLFGKQRGLEVGDLVDFDYDAATGGAVNVRLLQRAVEAKPDASGDLTARAGDVTQSNNHNWRNIRILGGILTLTSGVTVGTMEGSSSGGKSTITGVEMFRVAVLAPEAGVLYVEGATVGDVDLDGGDVASFQGVTATGRVRATKYRRVLLQQGRLLLDSDWTR